MIRLSTTAVLLAAVFAGGGCSARNGLLIDRWLGANPKPTAPVSHIVCVWEAAQGRDMKGTPCRGMAGNISFYTTRDAAPVPVDGTLMVYVFDNQGPRDEQTKPIHKFKFDSAAWNRHLKTTQLGPTYHVFIPYTRKTVKQVETALSVRFIPKEGPAAASEMVSLTLPGPMDKEKYGAKLHVVSQPASRRKVDVSTFKPDEYLNGTNAPADNAVKTDADGTAPNSMKFHDFDLGRKTRVRSLGPVRQPLAAGRNNRDDLRQKQNEQLRSLLAGFNKHSPAREPDRDASDSPRSFRLDAAPRDSVSAGATRAAHEREAPLPDSPTRSRHPLLDSAAELGPRTGRLMRPAGATGPLVDERAAWTTN